MSDHNIKELYIIMKKVIALLLAILCSLSVFCVSASADDTNQEHDPLADKFREVLDPLDNSPFDYNPDYMVMYACEHFLELHDNPEFVKVPAAEYEAFLHAHFAITDETINDIRHYFDEIGDTGPFGKFYDEAANTYTIWAFGGMGIGMPTREYSHYVEVGDYYEVFYNDINFVYLYEALPDGTHVGEYLEGLGYREENDYPATLEYDGIVFTYDFMEGYYAILPEKLDSGMIYVVELKDDIVRVINMEPYGTKWDPLDLKFMEVLSLVDGYYGYDEHYMVMFANDYFFERHEGDYQHIITVPAQEYEEVLNRYFYIDTETMYNIRHLFDDEHETFYDEATKTYNLWSFGGLGIDGVTSRHYSHYVYDENDTSHTYPVFYVYYAATTYEFLADVLPEGVDEYEYIESLYGDFMEAPYTIDYNGSEYLWSLGGYYRVLSYDNNYGKKYTVEFDGEIVRIISCEDYKEEEPEETNPETEPVTEPVTDPVTEPETTPETAPETRVETNFVTFPPYPLVSEPYDTVAATGTATVTKTDSGCGNLIGGGLSVIAILTLGGIMIAKKKD